MKWTFSAVSEPEYVPQDDEQAFNLEHILPEHPDQGWSDIDPETAAAYYKRLGNMVILQAKKNLLVGNSSYKVKRPILLASSFILTQNAGSHISWGIKEITERQKKLAKIAVQTWPLQI